ncbi:MAG: hypothetical protein IKP64_05040 [Selenomonadaceae bacterium]|nr:hypothetical protein [Selenomonadaceae bacterium]
MIHTVIDIVVEAFNVDFPGFDYREKLVPIIAVDHFRHYDNLPTPLNKPHNLPDKLIDIYETLFDFYYLHELESFRAEFGDHILCQICNEEIAPL